MYKKFENLSSSLFIGTLVALIYAFLFLFIGLLPRIGEVAFFPFLYPFLFVCFIVSSLYSFLLLILWTGGLAGYASLYGEKKCRVFFVIFSFFIPIYNFFGPSTFFTKFSKVLKIDGVKFLIIAWQVLFCITGGAFLVAAYFTFSAMDLFSYRVGIYLLFLSVILELIYLAVLLLMVKRFGDGFKDFYDGRSELQ